VSVSRRVRAPCACGALGINGLWGNGRKHAGPRDLWGLGRARLRLTEGKKPFRRARDRLLGGPNTDRRAILKKTCRRKQQKRRMRWTGFVFDFMAFDQHCEGGPTGEFSPRPAGPIRVRGRRCVHKIFPLAAGGGTFRFFRPPPNVVPRFPRLYGACLGWGLVLGSPLCMPLYSIVRRAGLLDANNRSLEHIPIRAIRAAAPLWSLGSCSICAELLRSGRGGELGPP